LVHFSSKKSTCVKIESHEHELKHLRLTACRVEFLGLVDQTHTWYMVIYYTNDKDHTTIFISSYFCRTRLGFTPCGPIYKKIFKNVEFVRNGGYCGNNLVGIGA